MLSNNRDLIGKSDGGQIREEAVRNDTFLASHVVAASAVAQPVTSFMKMQPVNVAVIATPIAARVWASQFLRPQWTIAALPYLVLEPAPILYDPVRVGDFLLWADPDTAVSEAMKREDNGLGPDPGDGPVHHIPVDNPRPIPVIPRPIPLPLRRAFFALAVPHLLDFSLTVQATVQPDRSIKLTGGTVILTVGIYAQENLQVVESYRQAWSAALAQAGYGNRTWKFLPQSLRNLQAALDLPLGHAASEPQISTNTNAGTVTFVINLSETSVLIWKSALEQRNGSAIPGICRLTASYYGRTQNQVDVKDQVLSAPLGTLLINRGPEDIRTINPQQTLEAKLLVVAQDLVENVTIALHPNAGQAPETQIFGHDGGLIQVSITTQDVNAVEVDWNAQVTYKSVNWPAISTSGKLSSGNSWIDTIKPDSWIANYIIMALLVDQNGKAVPIANAGSNYHVNGVLTFTASYIPSTNILVTPFDASNQLPVTVALPRFPGQPFGDLVLNMFATRDGLANTQTRKLASTESWVVVKIYPDAHIEIKTSSDALPELSSESEMLGLLARLQ